MEDTLTQDTFDAVWKRVSDPEETDPIAALEDLICQEAYNREYYTILQRRSSSKGLKAAFRDLARREGTHEKALRGHHYLLTGEICPQKDHPPANRPILTCVRELYSRSMKAAQMYRTAASSCTDPQLHDLYMTFSENELSNCRTLTAIIYKCMG